MKNKNACDLVRQNRAMLFYVTVVTKPSSHQSEPRTAATVWNWSGKTLSPGALLAGLYFSSCHIFFRPFRLFLVPTICPWVFGDVTKLATEENMGRLVK